MIKTRKDRLYIINRLRHTIINNYDDNTDNNLFEFELEYLQHLYTQINTQSFNSVIYRLLNDLAYFSTKRRDYLDFIMDVCKTLDLLCGHYIFTEKDGLQWNF